MQLCRAESACKLCDYNDALTVEKMARDVVRSMPESKLKLYRKCKDDYKPPQSLDSTWCVSMKVSDGEALLILGIIIFVCVPCVSGGFSAYYFAFSPAAKARHRGGGEGKSSESSSKSGAAISYPTQQQEQQQHQPMAYGRL